MVKKKKIEPKISKAPVAPHFADVQKILNDALTNWQNQHGRAPHLNGHDPADGSLPTFDHAWDSKANLLAASGHGQRLIQPEVRGNARGNESNLVIDLRTGMPLRMPKGGPFVSDPDIQIIVDWIDANCPD